MLFTNMSSMAPYVKAGRLKALGVSGSQRAAVLPDVPTMAEAGYPQLDIGTWFALVAPAATPRPIVTELNRRMVKILALPDVRTQFARQGVEPRPGSVEEAAEYLKKDVARWGRILQDAGITLN
jgi:tripartite-type tricarboxylate transporter receptor subunit TctC